MQIEKTCDRCGGDQCTVELRGESIRNEDVVLCRNCGLKGNVVFHGATVGDRIEDQFDVGWTDPETDCDWRV